MSGSSGLSNLQAVYAWRGGMWRPVRGLHEGLRCEDCKQAKPVMYRDAHMHSLYCEEHKPTYAFPTHDRRS